jgi:DNA-binding IclR family transcriptional regulator
MKPRKIQKRPNIYKVQSLDRALDILDSFSFQKRELTLTEICQLTSLNKTTAKRLVFTLTSRDYLRQATELKRYQLGLRVFELGGIVFSSFSLLKAANHLMSQLRNATECTVLLGVVMDDQLVYVDKRDGTGMIRISSDIGWRKPLHYGMLGMVLTAYLPPEKVNDILQKYPLTAHTINSITDQHAFSLRLEEIRKEGCVIEWEEAVEGMIGIAAPIRDYSRQVVAALGVSLPKGQSNIEKKVQETVDLLRKTCDEISSNLGYLKI